jgi:hypothetical protein
MRNHLGVAENRRPAAERGACCGDETGIERDLICGFHHAAGVDHANGDRRFIGRDAREIGF